MLQMLLDWVDRTPLFPFLIVAFFLGLAPFFPEPHLVEKLKMLFHGKLVRPIDIFDLFYHALPWAFLILKLIRLRSQ
ncbi:MAG: hypothetical protein KDD33_05405 [Bdellovibrionales bacterium]|nr:hypothetical protein [Bdellovibrionales bacterium]